MNILPFYSCGALFILSELLFLKTISKRDFTKIIPGDGYTDDHKTLPLGRFPPKWGKKNKSSTTEMCFDWHDLSQW